jgi:1-aminocyclopropane-1-carboxylate synthase
MASSEASAVSATSTAGAIAPTPPVPGLSVLSQRGTRAIQPALSYFDRQLQGARAQYDPVERPDGYVLMAVAENRLNFEQARLRLAEGPAVEEKAAAYTDMCGMASFREAFARVAEQFIVNPDDGGRQQEGQGTASSGGSIDGSGSAAGVGRLAVDPTHLVVSAGCGALVNQLGFLLCNGPSDAVLLPTPTYGALYNDFSVLARVAVVDMPMEEGSPGVAPGHAFKFTPALLEGGAARARAAGLAPRIVFLINPNNPLGIVHSAAEVAAVLAWCAAHGVHAVVDEVYANSVYGLGLAASGGAGSEGSEGGPAFVSALRVMAEAEAAAAAAERRTSGPGSGSTQGTGEANRGGDPAAEAGPGTSLSALRLATFARERLHVLWGFSKDFCMSGYRVGVLHTRNEALLRALGNVNYFCAVSNDTQARLRDLITDLSWVRSFFAANRTKLAASYAAVTQQLDAAGIPYLPATSGMFVYVDLRRWLPPPVADGAGCTTSEAAAAGPVAPPPAALTAPGVVSDVEWQRERALTAALFDQAHILFTPGEACHSARPGWYRACFAWVSLEAAVVGFQRLRAFVEARQ